MRLEFVQNSFLQSEAASCSVHSSGTSPLCSCLGRRRKFYCCYVVTLCAPSMIHDYDRKDSFEKFKWKTFLKRSVYRIKFSFRNSDSRFIELSGCKSSVNRLQKSAISPKWVLKYIEVLFILFGPLPHVPSPVTRIFIFHPSDPSCELNFIFSHIIWIVIDYHQ